jgi:hypothetical protein
LCNLILGTGEFLSLHPDFVENQQEQESFECNKDTGGLKTFHCWSRGIFFIVSAGGHIEYWQPLYRLLNCAVYYLLHIYLVVEDSKLTDIISYMLQI